MKINLSQIEDEDVSIIEKYFPDEYYKHQINIPTYKNTGMEIGEHYKLLSYFSSLFSNKVIFDLGSRTGISALALGHSKKNSIASYDLNYVNPPYNKSYPNITFFQKNVLNEDFHLFLYSPLILLDLDPHDGIQETIFLQKLRDISYKGLIILDDISTNDKMNWFPQMREFWETIPEEKYDLTKYGHGSGTGLVNFGMQIEFV